jgi:hypothetical protein
VLRPEQAKGLRAFLRQETGWPEGPVQEQIDDALAWHEDGPGGAWLNVMECAIAADAVGPQPREISERRWLFDKLKNGALMDDNGNADGNM